MDSQLCDSTPQFVYETSFDDPRYDLIQMHESE
jgi:hypothetical protein